MFNIYFPIEQKTLPMDIHSIRTRWIEIWFKIISKALSPWKLAIKTTSLSRYFECVRFLLIDFDALIDVQTFVYFLLKKKTCILKRFHALKLS